MGSFSASCAFSGITLYNEPVVLIPLTHHTYKTSNSFKGAQVYGGGGLATTLFEPLTLPLFGNLGEYGRLDSVTKNRNTSLISQVYEMKIQEFADICCSGGSFRVKEDEYDDKRSLEIEAFGCFVHPEIYKRFTKGVTDIKYGNTVWRSDLREGQLKALGCQYLETVSVKDREMKVYAHEDAPHIQFYTYGWFTDLWIGGKAIRDYGAGTLAKMHKALLEDGHEGIPPSLIKKAKSLDNLAIGIRNDTEKAKEELKRREDAFRKLRNLPPDSDTPVWFSLYDAAYTGDYIRGLRDAFKVMFPLYFKEWEEGRLLQETADLKRLIWSFTAANRMMMPTMTGPQQPEHVETFLISNFINKVALERLKDNRWYYH